MTLGPIQQQWVDSLRKYPERQYVGILGRRSIEGTIKACCLGQAKICLDGEDAFNNAGIITSYRFGTSYLSNYDANRLGLHSGGGEIIDGMLKESNNLASANDRGATWAEIADFIEQNPEKVFKTSK
jgi:hypothetical protein